MSAQGATVTSAMTETIPSEAREAARRLGELFQRDSELAKLQDEALGRLRAANQQLWTGLHPDALSLLYDHTEAVGIHDHARIRSRITAIIADTRAAGGDDHEIETAVLRTVQEIHWTIHRARIDYQTACEDRRHLAADIGEHSQRMIAALQTAGCPARDRSGAPSSRRPPRARLWHTGRGPGHRAHAASGRCGTAVAGWRGI